MQGQDIEATIKQWLNGKPAWYSPALHMALSGGYSTEDVKALAALVCKSHGVDGLIDCDKLLQPYSPADLSNVGMSEREVVIESVTAISGVNAIEPGSRLDLATSGLTVVYGNNGSGKSGFSRTIRNTCTSRTGAEDILPNVFEGSEKTSISIEARIDGVPRTLFWTEGNGDPYPSLPEVAFFDSACAVREVSDKDNEILYTPKIIDALAQFSELVSSVAEMIQSTRDGLKLALDERAIPAEIKSSRLVQESLNFDDPIDAQGEIDAAKLTETDLKRMSALPSLINADPSVEIPRLERRLDQLREMRSHLASLHTCCSDAFADSYETAKRELEKAEGVAMAARELLRDSSQLEGIGGDYWRGLWEAARRYSEAIAYPNENYPYLGEGALCPLCQQSLSAETVRRMNVFDEYVMGAAEKNLADKKEEVGRLTAQFLSAIASIAGDKGTVGVLSSEDARNQMDSLITKTRDWITVPERKTLETISQDVENAEKAVRSDMDDMERRLQDSKEGLKPGAVELFRNELIDLKGRAWVVERANDIVADAKKREVEKRLEAACGECNTRSISALVSNVSKVEIVERMQQCFESELNCLKAGAQPVSMETHARFGQEKQRIGLKGTKEKVSRVLSEGEQKVVALSGFFALLDVLPTSSTVIMDDPVTSLDHVWRLAVAERIVQESRVRPVVVFTHDPAFCVDLSDCAKKFETVVEYRSVYKRNHATGVIVDGLDWAACKVKERIKILRDRANDIDKAEKAGEYRTDAERDALIRDCYSSLRSTWERAVEEVLLNGVVQRAQRPVHTQQLKHLDDITRSDIDVADAAMTKCSRITSAHDAPLMAPDQVPSASELCKDIDELNGWIKVINKRRNS